MIDVDPSALVDNTWVLVLTPVVIGIVQALKALRIPKRFAPLVTLIVAIGAAVVWYDGPWRAVTLTGVVVGLSSSGLYSGITSTTAEIQASKQRRADPPPPG